MFNLFHDILTFSARNMLYQLYIFEIKIYQIKWEIERK